MSKKQYSVSLSTVEAEYIAAESCCAQLFWMKKLLHDYGITQDTMCVFYDNKTAINLSKKSSPTLEIEAHRDSIPLHSRFGVEFITIDSQKADIFTKPLDGLKFETLHKTIGVGIIP